MLTSTITDYEGVVVMYAINKKGPIDAFHRTINIAWTRCFLLIDKSNFRSKITKENGAVSFFIFLFHINPSPDICAERSKENENIFLKTFAIIVTITVLWREQDDFFLQPHKRPLYKDAQQAHYCLFTRRLSLVHRFFKCTLNPIFCREALSVSK